MQYGLVPAIAPQGNGVLAVAVCQATHVGGLDGDTLRLRGSRHHTDRERDEECRERGAHEAEVGHSQGSVGTERRPLWPPSHEHGTEAQGPRASALGRRLTTAGMLPCLRFGARLMLREQRLQGHREALARLAGLDHIVR